jgi:hypothetical protein
MGHAQPGVGALPGAAYHDGFDELGLEFEQIKSMLAEQVCQLDRYWEALQEVKKALRCANKHFQDEETKAKRWQHRYEAVRAERDEYYSRLVRISRGEPVDNLVAPAEIPYREETSPPRPMSLVSSVLQDDEPDEECEFVEYIKDRKNVEPNEPESENP